MTSFPKEELSVDAPIFDPSVYLPDDIETTSVPVGTIVPLYGNVVPSDYMILQEGACLDGSLYPELYSAIGTTNGSTNGEGWFNLPSVTEECYMPVAVNNGQALLSMSDSTWTVIDGRDYLPEHVSAARLIGIEFGCSIDAGYGHIIQARAYGDTMDYAYMMSGYSRYGHHMVANFRVPLNSYRCEVYVKPLTFKYPYVSGIYVKSHDTYIIKYRGA